MSGTSPEPASNRPRKWKRLILIPSLVGLVAGYIVSYVFPPKYTSQSLVLVEAQLIPDTIVPPVISADFTQRVALLQQQVLAGSRLRPMVERIGVRQEEQATFIKQIRENMSVEPVVMDISIAAADQQKKSTTPLPGFYVNYYSTNPSQTQQICSELTSLFLEENLRSRAEMANGTVDFLQREADGARETLRDKDQQLIEQNRKKGPHTPEDDAQQKTLALEYEQAKTGYSDLLAKLRMARLALEMENQQAGGQMRILQPADLPDAPAFPNRLNCAFGGLASGLTLGIVIALWRRFRPASAVSDESATGEPVSSFPRRSFFGHS